MKRFSKHLSPHRILAIVLTVVLFGFALFVFYSQVADKGNLEKAKITEVLQLEDEQGLIYQNFLVYLYSNESSLQVRVPVNLPEVRGFEVGDVFYLQQSGSDEFAGEYHYASADRSLEFLLILTIFVVLIFIVLGTKPLVTIFPSITFLVLILAGVFNLSPEIRFVFLSILGFMAIISLISILWFYQDLVLGLISALVVIITLLFSVLLQTLLVNYTNSSETIRFEDIFSRQSLVYDYSQAKLLVTMIFVFGLVLNLMINLIKQSKEYVKAHKKTSRYSLIKFNVGVVQSQTGQILNLIFFLALGLNFMGLISEDYSNYKFIWNNSFFFGVIIDGIVAATGLIVGGYIMSLLVSVYHAGRKKLSSE